MSLQLVANHLAQKGRGPDSNLVHMSNREVAGLQALAKRHGGSLSVNPDTGLPEAGFLDSILPTIAGAGLTYFSGGAISPLMAAGIVGGISALDSKDLSKGLMAGLGAYGGAGLTQGFMGAGLGAVGPGLTEAAAADATAQGLTGEAYNQAVQNQVASGLAEKNLAAEGVSQLFSNPGQTLETIGGGSGYKAAGILGAAAAPMLADEMVETTTEAPPQDRGKIRPYTYSRQQAYPTQDYQGNMGSKERRYFNEGYTAGDPYAAAGGGLVALASGGYTNQNIFRPTTPLPANNMYGASRDAYDYLMGVNPTSGGQPYDPNRPFPPGMRPEIPEYGMPFDPMRDVSPQVVVYGPDGTAYGSPLEAKRAGVQNPLREPPAGVPIKYPTKFPVGNESRVSQPKTGKGRYEFDPVTRQYKFIPDPITPVDVAAPVFENPMQTGGGGGDSESREAQRLAREKYFDNMTPAEREAHAESLRTGGNFLEKVLNPLGFLNIFRGLPLPEITPEENKANQDLEAMTIRDLNGNLVAYKLSTDQFAGYQPNSPVPGGVPPVNPGAELSPEKAAELAKQAEAYSPPQDPAQAKQAAIDAGANAGPPGKPPAPAPVAPAPVQMVNVTERWNGEDAPDPGQGWTRQNLGRGEVGYTRTVSRPAGGGALADAAQDDRIAAFDAMRSGADRNSVTPGGGSRDASPATGDRGYGSQGQHAATGGLSTPYGFQRMAHGGIAALHQYNLGSYSDGGRLLKGPGDGVSDDIPATIGRGQPARLADGEFVIPARIVSELGNGSTDAGARALYKMMDRIQAGRRKTVGKDQVAKNSKAARHLPA